MLLRIELANMDGAGLGRAGVQAPAGPLCVNSTQSVQPVRTIAVYIGGCATTHALPLLGLAGHADS